MAKSTPLQDRATLEMALVGYELERQKIDEKIRQIQAQLGRRKSSGGTVQQKGAPRKRILSAAARQRIAAAQRRRWAEHRRKAAQAAKGQKS